MLALLLALVSTGASASSAGPATPSVRVLCHKATLDNAVSYLPPSGSFVIGAGRVWRVAGCALFYVPSWATYGGTQRITPLSAADFDAAFHPPIDGTFISSIQTGAVYRIVLSAPIYVSTWAAFGGPQPTVGLDEQDFQHAGEFGPWHALKPFPAIETQEVFHWEFVRSGQDGRVYQFVDGVPIYVTNWDIFGGPQPAVTVDGTALDRAGQPGVWRFVRKYPLNYTYLVGVAPGKPGYQYVTAAGAPIYLATPGLLDESANILYRVNEQAIDLAGTAPAYDHLLFQPPDGTFLYGITSTTSTGYWVHAGAAVPVTDVNACIAAGHGFISVDNRAVVRAGTGGVWNHLSALPAHPPTPPC
jgi:hypothetical protein